MFSSNTTSAAAAADNNNNNNSRVPPASLPQIDLRNFTQSELLLLARSSAPPSLHYAQNDVVIPSIDRANFNESAGSRRQTYSRFRLSPPGSASQSSGYRSRVEPQDEDNSRIVSALKQLFETEEIKEVGDDPLVPIEIGYNEEVSEELLLQWASVPVGVANEMGLSWVNEDSPCSNVGLYEVPVSFVAEGSGRKRKRGRPRKDERRVMGSDIDSQGGKGLVVYGGEEMGLVSRNGGVVDLVALGNLEDPFGDELERRTMGLETEEELLGFLRGVNGDWVDWRMEGKVVNAAELGDALPHGWKVVVAVKKREDHHRLSCERYIRFCDVLFPLENYLLSLL